MVIKVGSRLTDHKPCALLILQRPFLYFLDGLAFIGLAVAHHRLSASCVNRVDSLTRWLWMTLGFQAIIMSDSINLRLIAGCLLTIANATLCQRL